MNVYRVILKSNFKVKTGASNSFANKIYAYKSINLNWIEFFFEQIIYAQTFIIEGII